MNTIGIDFGTTKTMVSYFNPATGRVELVRLGRDRDSIPTTVHVDESGAFLFGEDADDQIETDPEGYSRAFKLHLGEKDPVLSRSDETAESLTARFLRHVKEECEQSVFHGEAVTDATITIPVSFAPARRAALKRAAEAAGFSSVSFVPEPEAAGTAFLRDNPTDKFSRALVFDWGGGTLDIAIIYRDEDGTIHADRHCAEGRDDVGGEEMDRGLFENLKYIWEQTFSSPLLSSEENEPKLLRESEKVKIGLSRKEMVPFRQGKNKIDVTRDQFRQIVEQLLQASVDLVNSALSKNKVQGNPEPDAILLIGGTCQSPVVRETMEKNFPKLQVLSWHHSHEAVALGAIAVQNSNTTGLQDSQTNYGSSDPPQIPIEDLKTDILTKPTIGKSINCNNSDRIGNRESVNSKPSTSSVASSVKLLPPEIVGAVTWGVFGFLLSQGLHSIALMWLVAVVLAVVGWFIGPVYLEAKDLVISKTSIVCAIVFGLVGLRAKSAIATIICAVIGWFFGLKAISPHFIQKQ